MGCGARQLETRQGPGTRDGDFRRGIAAAQVAVDVAAARYESALHSVNESVAQLGVRRAELGLARQALEDAEIRAPFDGVVEQRYVAPGAYVQVGQPIVMLDKVDPWRFRASVPEREAAAVQLGQRVAIRIEGEPIAEGSDRRISPSVETEQSIADHRSARARRRPSRPRSSLVGSRAATPPRSVRRSRYRSGSGCPHPGRAAGGVREFAGVEKVWRGRRLGGGTAGGDRPAPRNDREILERARPETWSWWRFPKQAGPEVVRTGPAGAGVGTGVRGR